MNDPLIRALRLAAGCTFVLCGAFDAHGSADPSLAGPPFIELNVRDYATGSPVATSVKIDVDGQPSFDAQASEGQARWTATLQPFSPEWLKPEAVQGRVDLRPSDDHIDREISIDELGIKTGWFPNDVDFHVLPQSSKVGYRACDAAIQRNQITPSNTRGDRVSADRLWAFFSLALGKLRDEGRANEVTQYAVKVRYNYAMAALEVCKIGYSTCSIAETECSTLAREAAGNPEIRRLLDVERVDVDRLGGCVRDSRVQVQRLQFRLFRQLFENGQFKEATEVGTHLLNAPATDRGLWEANSIEPRAFARDVALAYLHDAESSGGKASCAPFDAARKMFLSVKADGEKSSSASQGLELATIKLSDAGCEPSGADVVEETAHVTR
jgi:hypothetical protein